MLGGIWIAWTLHFLELEIANLATTNNETKFARLQPMDTNFPIVSSNWSSCELEMTEVSSLKSNASYPTVRASN